MSAPPFSCASVPVGTYSELGGVELDVLRTIGEPHWTANVGPLNDQYTTQLGSDESSGSPGDWDIYAYIYNVQPLSYGTQCLYHAHVTGSEAFPYVTQIGEPACDNISMIWIPRPEEEGQPSASSSPSGNPSQEG